MSMVLRNLAFAASCLLLATGASAQTAAPADTMSSESFMVFDLDGSGDVDAIEFGIAMGYAFTEADADSDGKLTAEEAAKLGLPASADANGDGSVDLVEYLVVVRKDFIAADRDGNHRLHP